MPKHSLLIQRFPYGNTEASECVDWLVQTYHKAKLDPRFDRVNVARVNDTPITMTRNRAFRDAKAAGFDYMLLVDSDMDPDCELREGDPAARPFFETAVDFALAHRGPCVVAAPYGGPPPHENVYVFRWGNRGNSLDARAAGVRLDQYTREEAAVLSGVQEVAALPTGLMLLDLRALDAIPHPWTYYEYEGAGEECQACGQRARGPEAVKASTEDVTLTRDLLLAGVPTYCAWDSWAGHVKRYTVRKPRPYTTDVVAKKMRDAILRRTDSGDRLVEVKPPDRLAALLADRHKNGWRGAEPAWDEAPQRASVASALGVDAAEERPLLFPPLPPAGEPLTASDLLTVPLQ